MTDRTDRTDRTMISRNAGQPAADGAPGGLGGLLRRHIGFAPSPISERSQRLVSRLQGAQVATSVCPYCAVGCSQLVYSRDGKVIDIEGNPRSPINEGTLCPKGANAYKLTVNPHRVTHVLYRAPHSDHWETKPLEWALDQVARRVKRTRDEGFVEKTKSGRLLNAVHNLGTLGGATLDNEENYLIKKLFGGGLGVVSIENQARI